MPTPVSTARQCLTEEAARVLDDAVSVARRRCHAQTTSLHAVSALLSLPSSLLRDACSRARSPAYSHRLQFRALDLCVSVSLDRLPSAKSSSAEDDPPPVSNSLMAAIKRSQANQRRQPEMYQMTQHITTSICSISLIKVELKNFVVSILDDPIVSRVLGDAGFRSTEIKLAILHPPAPPLPARFFRGVGGSGGRCPPLFLCNLTDSALPIGGNNIPFPFPLAGGGDSDGDSNCRRIGEILVKSTGRNPLLVGVCAKDALASFKECVEKDKGEGVLPSQIVGLELISVEKEVMEFVSNGGRKEVFNSKVMELNSAVEKHPGPGVVVTLGELKLLVEEDGGSEDAVKFLVLKLSVLFKLHKKKMWLIAAAANSETYRKFLDRFPALEIDWDLHPLPITSSTSRSSVGGLCSKSSLMGSFVPFGGFFSTPSDLRSPLSVTKQPFTRCSLCNGKYDQELSAVMSGVCSASVADQHSSSLPTWLQPANSDVNKARNAAAEITVEKAESNAKILELQRKWDDICQRLHQVPKIPRPDASVVNPTIPVSLGFQSIASYQRSGSGALYSNDPSSSNLCSGVSAMAQNIKAPVISLHGSLSSKPKPSSQVCQSFPLEVDGGISAHSSCNLSLATDHVSSSSVSSVTTDLQLGTFAPTSQELKRPDSHFNRGQLEHYSCSISTERPVNDKASDRVFPFSPARPQLDQVGDYKLILQKLTEKVSLQIEACCDIAQIVSRRRGGNGPLHRASYVRQDAWICFIGPDRMGKKRLAEALAELMFGSRENLIAIDLSIQGRMIEPDLVFDTQLPDDVDVKSGRKEVVDYIAGELRKKPCSVVFLENVDKTVDLLAQRSLSNAIQTGKFPDSRGREVSIANAIILMTYSSTKGAHVHPCVDSSVKFSEERVLEARSWQMQIVMEHLDNEAASKSCSTVALANKRKQYDTNKPSTHKKPKGFLDLNLPLEEDTEEVSEVVINDGIDTITDASTAWFQDLLGQVENKVSFKPFDFDALSNKLLQKMIQSLQRRSGIGVRLEVDQDVMLQILAASWCSDQEGAVEDWINKVLGETYNEAQIGRFHPHKQTLLKIVTCPGRPVEQQAPGIRLPKMINLG